MTHDELLADINKEIDEKAFVPERYYPIRYLQALRAVVELHKPDILQGICSYCSRDFIQDCYDAVPVTYPCPTIQAIEKELG